MQFSNHFCAILLKPMFQAFPRLVGSLDVVQETAGTRCSCLGFSACALHSYHPYQVCKAAHLHASSLNISGAVFNCL